MTKNSDFYEENSRFNGLIKYYARQLLDPHAYGELWGFLWLLLNSGRIIPNDRYICVCIRNYFIHLKKTENNFFAPEFIFEKTAENKFENEIQMIEFSDIFKYLTNEEKQLFIYRNIRDFTFQQIAEIRKTSKQNECKRYRKMIVKLRNLYYNP